MSMPNLKLPYRGPHQRRQMCPRSQKFPQLMRNRPYISTRAYPNPKPCLFAIQVQNLELFDLDRLGLEFDRLFLPSKFVSRDACDLFCRKRWRNLLDLTDECANGFPDLLQGQMNGLFWPLGLAFGVVGVGGQSELNGPFVPLISIRVELRQAGKASKDQRQHAAGGGIQGPQMPGRALAGNTTHPGHHVVGGHSRWLIDYEYPVHRYKNYNL